MNAQENPTMQRWTKFWHHAEKENFKNLYSQNAVIFPPNKPTIQGNKKILDFMKNGIGKVDVLFEKEFSEINNNLIFEYGIFKDVDIQTKEILGIGKYSIVWVLTDNEWKILSHVWSMPLK
ncbi:YybH family protein [Aureivirga marina]|uniref:YybH family protein n=1 Tax=Aureivirga marina TaxID=1182451 RepID=UPI0018C99898|nr:nuclear transport factor 2 family protein [Aureivirga marina]